MMGGNLLLPKSHKGRRIIQPYSGHLSYHLSPRHNMIWWSQPKALRLTSQKMQMLLGIIQKPQLISRLAKSSKC